MRKSWSVILLLLFIIACKSGRKLPDVSKVKVSLTNIRFEQSLFAVDTLNLVASVERLNQQYPYFSQDFLFNILGSSPNGIGNDLPYFIRSYQPLANEVKERFANLDKEQKELTEGLRYVKHYFPDYQMPEKFITFIGPLNSFGNIITANALAVGLQMYLGAGHPLYQSMEGQQLYPTYISRRFDRSYMATNCIRNIIDDMYPARYAGLPLVEQMVEAGKRLYILDQLMPKVADSIKTGYTQAQLVGCEQSERNIWSFFMQNGLLYTRDPEIVRDYMTDAPNTPALGQASPGFIGQFTGWKIVQAWMSKKGEGITLKKLMEIPASEIFQQSGYKP
jgi:hypothetical protein